MGLLSSIAAALSEGVGNGMVANAKWGIEEEAQRKKEAADDARLKEQLKRYDDDRQSRDKYYAGLLEESKNERLSRAEQARLDRENNLKIAGMRDHGGGESSSLRELKFIDSQITSFDNTIEDLNKAYAAEVDPEKQKAIAGQIDNWRSKRQVFVTSDVVQKTIASNGKLGELYSAALYGGATAAKPEQAQDGNIPASLLVPPPSRPDANQSNWSGGDPSLQPQPKKTPTVQNNYGIWDRVSSDVSSLGSGLLNKMNNAYKTPLDR